MRCCLAERMKRIFDFCLALTGLFVSLPLVCLVAFAIRLQDGKEVFYLQDRVGRGGKIFRGVKFRSMKPAAEEATGPVQSEQDDPRVTRLGVFLRKTALDELPQLWNILKGDMSFVGPRALRPLESDGPQRQLKRIEEFEGFAQRSRVLPGLTGVAQVLAPRDIPREVKFKYDIWYVCNRSFRMDLELIMLSFIVTFTGKWEMRKRRFSSLADKLYAQTANICRKDAV